MQYERLTKNRIYIFSAHDEMQKSADTAFKFKQDPVFFWFTKITEPGWRVVVNTHTMELALLRPERSDVKIIFEGGLSNEYVKNETGIEKIISFSDTDKYLENLSVSYPTAYTIAPLPDEHEYDFIENPSRRKLWEYLEQIFSEVHDCKQEIQQLRAIKEENEINAIKKAVEVSIKGFEALKTNLASSRYEYELEAVLNAAFRTTGAGGHAYEPIVASGKNACTLHYNANNDPLPQVGLVLIDAAAEVDGYAADITRTYAVGTPTKRQIEVHGAVEKAHHKIIDIIKPGVALTDYINQVDEIMKDALQSIGLLKDRNDQKTYRKYFPHAVSHGLGLDVHESLGGFKEFKPGMVLTVEPGIYIPEEEIGVRIEDDILVTEAGNRNLSASLPTSL